MITSKIDSIKKISKQNVYDILGMPTKNFIANNAVVHNCDESIRFACLDGSTKVIYKGQRVKLRDIEGKTDFYVTSYNIEKNILEKKKAQKCIKVKRDKLFELKTKSGKVIKATKEHKFLTKNGWKELQELKIGDKIYGTKM